MPFNSESMIGFQEREEEALKATRVPEDTYLLEITEGKVFDSNGLPRLQVGHRTVAAKTDGQIGRYHTEFLGWFASETSESPKPIEERNRTIRKMTESRLQGYLKSLEESPTSDQDLGESLDEAITSLVGQDNPEEVREIMNAIGAMLDGQIITGAIKYSKNGDFVNLYANTFDTTIGAAEAVAV
tara:strand:- start:166 stop:720 length:555 start_codon:yes stop_codon:yes gene_type:complete